jgi:hypothetical protein
LILPIDGLLCFFAFNWPNELSGEKNHLLWINSPPVFREALALSRRGAGCFAAALADDSLAFNERYFGVQVDAVEKQATGALTVCWDHGRAAVAFAFQLAVEAARVGG